MRKYLRTFNTDARCVLQCIESLAYSHWHRHQWCLILMDWQDIFSEILHFTGLTTHRTLNLLNFTHLKCDGSCFWTEQADLSGTPDAMWQILLLSRTNLYVGSSWCHMTGLAYEHGKQISREHLMPMLNFEVVLIAFVLYAIFIS